MENTYLVQIEKIGMDFEFATENMAKSFVESFEKNTKFTISEI